MPAIDFFLFNVWSGAYGEIVGGLESSLIIGLQWEDDLLVR